MAGHWSGLSAAVFGLDVGRLCARDSERSLAASSCAIFLRGVQGRDSECPIPLRIVPTIRLIKLYTGIDYRFRPESYWAAARNPLEAALRNVKGRNRREMIKDYYEAGNLDQLGESLLGDTLDEQSRKNLKLIHPTFMGGEYLPDYARSEVEIARIELEATTNDVISLRARSSGLRIKYRLVDEYASEFRLPQQTSSRPFSRAQLC